MLDVLTLCYRPISATRTWLYCTQLKRFLPNALGNSQLPDRSIDLRVLHNADLAGLLVLQQPSPFASFAANLLSSSELSLDEMGSNTHTDTHDVIWTGDISEDLKAQIIQLPDVGGFVEPFAYSVGLRVRLKEVELYKRDGDGKTQCKLTYKTAVQEGTYYRSRLTPPPCVQLSS